MHISLINLLYLFGHKKKWTKRNSKTQKNAVSVVNEFKPGFLCMNTNFPNTRTENMALPICGAKGRIIAPSNKRPEL